MVERRPLLEDGNVRARCVEAAARSLEIWEEPHAGWSLLAEECAEVIAAINQYKRERVSSLVLARECADVVMMMHEANVLLPRCQLDQAILEKLERHEKRIEQRGGGNPDAVVTEDGPELRALRRRVHELEAQALTPSDAELWTMFRDLPEGINATEFRRLVYERCVVDARARRALER